MTLVLDRKDLAIIDEEFRADSQVWDVIRSGANQITEADFVGASEVRINKIGGFVDPQKYKRNDDNALHTIDISKETIKLTHEDWLGYEIDRLDQLESAPLTIQNIVKGHRQRITIPHRDKVAIQALYDNTGKKETDTVSADNVLDAYDAAEEYMVDHEIPGGYVMFVSAAFYRMLKNAKGVNRTFETNIQSLNGINRSVTQIDGSVPILKVAKDRWKGDRTDGKTGITEDVNFILTPLFSAAPVIRYGSVDLISADNDTRGYRDTIKGLDYYDVIVFDNAKSAIYTSVQGNGGGVTRSIENDESTKSKKKSS